MWREHISSDRLASWRKRFNDIRLALRETHGDETTLNLLLFIRYFVLLMLLFRFGINRSLYDEFGLFVVRCTMIAGLIYLILLMLVRGWKPFLFYSARGKGFQVIVDTISVSWFFIITMNVRSDLFLFYLLPLYIATSYFRLTWTVVTFVAVSLAHLIVSGIVFWYWSSNLTFGDVGLNYVLREGLLFILALGFLSTRSHRVPEEWAEQNRSLSHHIKESQDGIYIRDANFRLIYLSQVLRQRHALNTANDKCYQVIAGRPSPCDGCIPLIRSAAEVGASGERRRFEILVRPHHGDSYRSSVELSTVSKSSDTSVIGIISNLDQQRHLHAEITNLFQGAERRHDADRRELQRKEKFIDKELATLFDISRISANTDVNAQYQKIVAGTVELLDCQAGALRLLEKNPQEQDSLVLKATVSALEHLPDEVKYLDLSNGESNVVRAFLNRKVEMHADLRHGDTAAIYFHQNLRELNLRAQLCLPLLIKERAVGALTLYRQRAGAFTREEIRLGEALARYLAALVTIGEEVDRRQQILTALTELSRQIAGVDTIHELSKLAATYAQRSLNAEVASIFLFDNGRLRRVASAGIEDDWFPDECYLPGEGVTGQVVQPVDKRQFGRPQRINNAEKNLRILQDHRSMYDTKLKSGKVSHLMAVPLNGRSGSFGVLRVLNKLDPQSHISHIGYSEDEEELLYSLACQIAVAVENVRHLEQSKRHLAESNQRVRELDELNRISGTIAANTDLDDVMKLLVRLSGRLVKSDYSAIALVKENDLSFSYEDDPAGITIKPLHIRAREKGITHQIIESKQHAYFPEIDYSTGSHNPELETLQIRSYLGVPIKVQDSVLGVLFVHSRKPHAFDQAISLMQTFANEAAITIQRAQLFTTLQRRVAELTIMNNVMVHLTEITDRNELLQTVADGARSLAEASDAHIFLYNEQTQKFHFGAAAFAPDVHIKPITEPRPDGLTAMVAQQRRVLVFNDASSNPLFSNHPEWGLYAIAGLPLERGDHLIGVITVAYLKPHTLDADEIQSLELYARQASIAIQKTLLLNEVREQHNRQKQYLQETSTKLVEHTDREGLYTFIVQAGKRFLDVEDCSLSIVEPETCEVQLVASTSLPRHVFRENPTLVSREPGAGLTAYVAATGEHLRLVGEQIFKHPAWLGRFTDHLQYLPSKASKCLLIVPMRQPDGTIVGVLKAENKVDTTGGGIFTEFDEELLVVLADQAARILERSSEVERAARQAAHKERRQLAGDIHSIINVIGMGINVPVETAMERLALPKDDKSYVHLDQALRASRHTYDILANIMQDLRESILLDRGLRAALKYYADLMRKGDIDIVIDIDDCPNLTPQIQHVLYRIAQEAINNSLKHGELGKDGWIRISIKCSGGYVRLEAADNGIGFEKSDDDQPATMGLRYIDDLARLVKATAKVSSALGKGTRIQVEIPIPTV